MLQLLGEGHFAATQQVDFALQLADDLVDLDLDLTLDVLQFGTLDGHRRVARTELLGKLRDLTVDRGFLQRELLDHRRRQHFGQSLRTTACQDRTHLAQTALFCRAIRRRV